MDKYKSRIKIRMNVLSLVIAAILLIYVGLIVYHGGLPELPSFIKGFHIGVFIGAEIFLIFYLIKYRKARKHDAELKKLYIEENDERTGQILRHASSLSISASLVGLAIAAVIAGFFNSLIFYTLLAVLLFVLIVFFALLMYYSKKL